MGSSRVIKTIVGVVVIIAILVGMGIGISSLLNSNKAALYFDTMVEGVTVEDIVKEKGETAVLPTPERVGWEFEGWYYDREYSSLCGKGGQQITLNSSRTQLFAKWTPKRLTVTLIDENATNPSDRLREETVTYGNSFDLSLYSSQGEGIGYDYKWVLVDDGVNVDVDESVPYVVTEDVTFKRIKYAKTYELLYLYMDGVSEVVIDDTKTMLFGENFDFSEVDASRTGYTFDHWELENGDIVTSDTLLDADTYGARTGKIVLYGVYNINQYKVSFYTYDGVLLNSFDVDYNSLIDQQYFDTVEADATLNRTHYVFSGWKYGDEVVDPMTFAMPAGDVDFVAYYEREKYEVNYYINLVTDLYFDAIELEYESSLEGTIPTDTEIANLIGENGDAYRLQSLTYEGVEYTKAEFEATFTSIDRDMTVKINLEKYKLFVNFIAGDGVSIYKSVLINKDEPITMPEDPDSSYAPESTEQGTSYVFGGWVLNGEIFDGDYDFSQLTDDLNVYSEWYEYNYSKWSFGTIDGMVSVTAYNGTATNICVPTQVLSNGSMVDVTRVGSTNLAWPIQNIQGKKILIRSNISVIGEYAFFNYGTTEVVFDNGVNTDGLTIEQYAFGSAVTGYNQYSITSIKLPARTSDVHPLAFGSAINLVSIDVSDECVNYKSIDGVLYETKAPEVVLHTYPHAKEDTSFVIPSDVTKIGDYAFYYYRGGNGTLSALTQVSDSEGSALREVGVSAFKDAFTLTSIDLSHSNIVVIGADAFRNCFSSNVANAGFNFTSSATIASIGANAFDGTTYAGKLVLNLSSLTSLGDMAFYQAVSGVAFNATQYSIVLGGSITTVPINAFANSHLTIEVIDDNNISTIGDYAFRGVAITNAVFPETLVLGSQCFDSATITYIEFKDLPTLPSSIFANANMTAIKIDGLATIGESALRGATLSTQTDYIHNLQKIELGANCTITSLSNFVFRNNLQLTDITLCPSLTSLGIYAFAGCTALEEIVLPNSIQTIDGNCFNGCTNLKSITMPNNLETIQGQAFRNCTSLTKVEFNAILTSIGDSAFENTGLTSVNVSCSGNVASNAFSNCVNLVSVNITAKVLNADVFSGCSALKMVRINFPTDVQPIQITSIFNGCTSLETLILTGGVPTIINPDNVSLYLFAGLSEDATPRTINIYIPAGTKNNYLAVSGWLEYSLYLVEVNIQDNVAYEGSTVLRALENVSNITILDATDIGEYAFSGLDKLETLTLNSSSLISISDVDKAFEGVDLDNLVIKVPSNLLSEYQNSLEWASLKDRFVGETL